MSSADQRDEVPVSAGRITRLVAIVSAVVCIAGLCVELAKELFGWTSDEPVVVYLSVSYEANIPTWLTSILAVACSAALAVSARVARARGEPHVGRWWGLAAGFVYISVDETVQLHEMAGLVFDLGGVLYFSWVIFAGVIVVVVGAIYLGFLRQLEPRARWRFVIAGALYVGGAVLCELPLGWWTERHGSDNLGYGLIDWVEETLEIVGLNVFLFALVQRLAERRAGLRLAS